MVSLDDYQFLESFKRKRIRLTTKGSTFEGTVQRINLNKTIILEDVVEVQSGSRFVGSKLFFGQEILNVEFVSSPKKDALGDEDRVKVDQLSLGEFQPYRYKLMGGGDDDDDDDETKQIVNFVVVDEFHEKFGPAIIHIQKQKVIGIGLDGVGTFQNERLCWLQVAVKNQVYLFDILLLGARAFRNGLSKILESTDILKVMHDCRRIAGCLIVQFGVNLVNVFDTQVADVMQFYTETGGFLPTRVSTLQEVIRLHMKMPVSRLSSLSIKDKLCMENKEVWYVRPCPAPILKVMALSVIHLQPLRLMLLDILMSDYTSLVDSYLKTSQENPVRTEDIGKTGLELPQELREIELIKSTRQKWALDHYNITEDGLLDRYSIKPTSEPESEIQEQPEMLESSLDAEKNGPYSAVTSILGGRSVLSVEDTSTMPSLGRGLVLPGPVVPFKESAVLQKSPATTGPVSIMGGVAQNGTCLLPVMGRGFFNSCH
ncbi:piRNA biogenesis protein EXD1 [Tachysurus vachellii]|uniref:piRNA biogenesis protein EXD1 n=1 Tax=Tachysurus vachellii TaxID=175792 RepID=UPI00296B3F93|nr:piRNA biogenesis protein EXD1 [Tachysurus vachellii]